jgi:hypothetical protein
MANAWIIYGGMRLPPTLTISPNKDRFFRTETFYSLFYVT